MTSLKGSLSSDVIGCFYLSLSVSFLLSEKALSARTDIVPIKGKHSVYDTGQSTGRWGMESILPVDWPVTIDVMLTFDGHSDADGHDIGMYKQGLNDNNAFDKEPS